MKITSTLFLLLALACMLYISVGQVGGIYMGIDEAKKEATSQLAAGHLYTLIISSSDLRSGKASYINDKEIRYDGSLYDIASAVTVNGNTILKVFHDEKEEGLLSGLKDIVDGWFSTSPKSTRQHSVKQIVLIKDFVPMHKLSLVYNDSSESIPSSYYSYPIQAPLMAVLKSPPKLG